PTASRVSVTIVAASSDTFRRRSSTRWAIRRSGATSAATFRGWILRPPLRQRPLRGPPRRRASLWPRQASGAPTAGRGARRGGGAAPGGGEQGSVAGWDTPAQRARCARLLSYGSHTVTSAPPPSRLARLSRPPCASTISRQSVSPRPVPAGLVE